MAEAGTEAFPKIAEIVPGMFFFYGSLMDPDVLQTIAKTRTKPVLREGWIEGWQMKMWGVYPTLVPKEGARVNGMVWRIEDPQIFHRLQYYETDHYKPTGCTIHYPGAEGGLVRVQKGATFCWAGEEDSKDLEDGRFDLAEYQKHFKPSIMR